MLRTDFGECPVVKTGHMSGNPVTPHNGKRFASRTSCFRFMKGLNDDFQGATLVKASLQNSLEAVRKLQQRFRMAFLLCCVVLVLTRVLPAQDNASSKILDGEAQFTHEQLEQYYVVYKNSDACYLRSLFDGYLNSSGGTEQERQVLSKWDKAYLPSKFIVMSGDVSTFGGTLITILFQDRPDKVFVAWFIQRAAKRS